jgi:hypothetical protein
VLGDGIAKQMSQTMLACLLPSIWSGSAYIVYPSALAFLPQWRVLLACIAARAARSSPTAGSCSALACPNARPHSSSMTPTPASSRPIPTPGSSIRCGVHLMLVIVEVSRRRGPERILIPLPM